MKFAGRQVRLGDPAPVDIVIFDETNADEVQRAINPAHRVVVMPARPEEIWVGPRVAMRVLGLLPAVSLGEARRHPSGVTRGLLKELRGTYLQACLEVIQPKAVVTFIDNSGPFAWLSRRCRSFPLIAIQNGTRLPFVAEQDRGYYLQHLFSFGQREIEEFPAMGYRVEQFHPVGSLRASLHMRSDGGAATHDLVVVSTWRGNIGWPQDAVDTMRSMRIMDELLAKYARARRLRCAILLRAARGGEHWRIPQVGQNEEEYFRSIYGADAELIEPDFVTRNVYPGMQGGRVIVSCLSTAALEAFGWGKKVLFCNFTGTGLYHQGLRAEIVTTDAEETTFFAQLDSLLAMPQADYESRHRTLQGYYIANPAERPTHAAIADGIERIIGEHATRGASGNLTAYAGIEQLSNYTPESLAAYRRGRMARWAPVVAFLRDRSNGHAPTRVLEVGSGSSALLYALSQAGLVREALGIEYSESRHAFAERWKTDGGFQSVRNVCANFADIDMGEARWDWFVVIDNTFTYLHPEDAGYPSHLLRAAHRALAPAGRLLIDFINYANRVPGQEYRQRVDYAPTDRFSHGLYTHRVDAGINETLSVFVRRDGSEDRSLQRSKVYSLADFTALLAGCGFTVTEVFADFQYTPYNEQQSERLVVVARKAT